MPLTLPPLPDENIPVVIQTPHSTVDGDLSHEGIDTRSQWWCEVSLRPRRGDAVGALFPPGAARYNPLVDFILGAEDLYEAETVAHRTIQIGRHIAALVADHDDQGAWNALKGKGLPNGYTRTVRDWLKDVDYLAPEWETLRLEGAGAGGDLWTVSMVAKHLGYSGPSANGSARKQLSRWGIRSLGREAGRRGESQYLASEVMSAHDARPGKGRHGATREGGRFAAADES